MHCAGSTINATCILCCVQVLSRSTPRGYWTPIYTYCVQWERPQRLHQQFRCDLGHCDAFNGAMVCLQCPGAPQTVHSAAGAACITLLHVPIPVRAPVHIGHTMPVPVLLVYMYGRSLPSAIVSTYGRRSLLVKRFTRDCTRSTCRVSRLYS